MKLLVLWTCSPTSFKSQHSFVSLSLSLVLLCRPFGDEHQTMFGSISTRQACNEELVRSGHHFTSLRLQSTWKIDSGIHPKCIQQTVATSNNRTEPIEATSNRPWPNRCRPRSIFPLSERSAFKCWLFPNKTQSQENSTVDCSTTPSPDMSEESTML